MKMIITGAGATAYSEYTNPDRRPPFSDESLLRMFNKPAYHIPSIDYFYNQFFSEALKLYDNDIEEVFTAIYILANSRNLAFKDEKLVELKQLGRWITPPIENKKFSNLLNIFQGKLAMEMQLCIGTNGEFPKTMPPEMPICSWHRKIVKQLSEKDVVVNFNYDRIMPYALLNEKKLSKNSFCNPYIKEVEIPENSLFNSPVTLITPHGSFIWHIKREEKLL